MSSGRVESCVSNQQHSKGDRRLGVDLQPCIEDPPGGSDKLSVRAKGEPWSDSKGPEARDVKDRCDCCQRDGFHS